MAFHLFPPFLGNFSLLVLTSPLCCLLRQIPVFIRLSNSIFLLLRKYTYNVVAYRKWQIWGMLLIKSNRIITGIFFMSWIQRPGHQGASYQESIWQSPPWGSPLCQPVATPEGLGPLRWGGPGYKCPCRFIVVHASTAIFSPGVEIWIIHVQKLICHTS